MIYLPDTDTVNYLPKKIVAVQNHYQAAVDLGDQFILSLVVDYEVSRYHILKKMTGVHRIYTNITLNWDRQGIADTDWKDASDLWADHHRSGKSITDSDLLIAITAKKCNAILVTNNTRHFEGLGIPLVNWTE